MRLGSQLIPVVFLFLLSLGADAPDVPALISRLAGPDPIDRGRAAFALGVIGKHAEPAIPQLIANLEDNRAAEQIPHFVPFPARSVASFSAEALGRIGPGSVPALAKALQHRDPNVRSRVIQTLSAIGPLAKDALPELKKKTHSEESEDLRYMALHACAVISPTDSECLELLVGALTHQSEEFRSLAARRLGAAGPAAKAAVPTLVRALADTAYRSQQISVDFFEQRAVRFDVAEALGKIGPAAGEAVTELTRMMAQDDDAEVRVAAALALIRINSKNQAALQKLITELKYRAGRGSSTGPAEAALALEQIGPLALPAQDAPADGCGEGRWCTL